MSEPTDRAGDTPRPDFGEPEAEFRPTFGQTAAGLLIYCSITAVCFACALLDTDPLKRFAMGSVGVTTSVLTAWIYELRKWRLWVCPGGVVQRRAWVVDEIAWAEVREVVVERYLLSRHPDRITLVRDAGGGVVIRPINCGEWKRLFDVLLKAVEDRQIAIRRRVVSGD